MNRRDFGLGMATGAAILLTGMMLGGMAQDATTPKTPETFDSLSAKEIKIVDDKGRVMGLLTTRPQGGAVTLFNATGGPMLAMGTGDAGGLVHLLDREGTIRSELNADGEMLAYSASGDLRARVAPYKEDGNTRQTWAGQFTAYDRNGAIVGRVPRDGIVDR